MISRTGAAAVRTLLSLVFLACLAGTAAPAFAATIMVPKGGNLQAALDAADPGDTILLEPGATYIGNFVLPVHGGHRHITLRSATDDALLPPYGTRMSPEYSPLLARLKSPNDAPALATAPGAAFWTVMLLQFEPNTPTGSTFSTGDIIALGSGSSAQSTLDTVPHDLVIDRVYIHGDPVVGQKRGIALNSAFTTIVNSYIADMKAINQDTQAIGGWNGPGGYWIENNYLEASGDNVLIGGGDPKIPNLVPSDIVFRGNTMSRPVSWRDPILPTPAAVVATATAGGLPPGTYAYRVVARGGPILDTTLFSAASALTSVTLDAGGGVVLGWAPVPGATSYRVYGRAPGGATQFWSVTSPNFVDVGATGTAGSGVTATAWRVKNVFELKNARRVRAEFNIFENNWRQSQSGVAVLFTTRNQEGNCRWCVVEDVVFEHNIVRHVGAALHVLGIDNVFPSGQTNTIRIRNNLFYDVSRSWGGNGNLLLINQGPRDVILDHNTYITPNGGSVIFSEGPSVEGFVFTNNVNSFTPFPIIGTGTGPGFPTLSKYFGGSLVCDNVFARANPILLPQCNYTPPEPEFEACFRDYANGDYEVRSECRFKQLGADVATVKRGVRVPQRLVVGTTVLARGTVGAPYTTTLVADGGLGDYTWSVCGGELPPGLAMNETGVLEGIPTAGGTYSICVRVSDDLEATAVQLLRVVLNTPPRADDQTVETPEDVAVTFTLNAEDADGDRLTYEVTRKVRFGLLRQLSDGMFEYVPNPAFEGTDTFDYTVTDTSGLSASATVTVIVTHVNHPPTAMLQHVSTNHDVAVTFDLAASDPDGDQLTYAIGVPSNGIVSGTPPTVTYTPAPGFSGTDAFTYTVSDGQFIVGGTVRITVFENPVIVTRTSLPDGRVGRRFMKMMETTGGTVPFTWSVVSGILPDGLTLGTATGSISGTPTTAGTFSVTLKVVDAVGSSDTVTLTIVIEPVRH